MSRPSRFSWIFGRPTSSLPAEKKWTNGGPGDEELGVTEELRDFVKSLTTDTFKDHAVLLSQDDMGASAGDDGGNCIVVKVDNSRKDLSDWQERHAVLILSRVKEIAQLRYVLCPRHMKENKFWTIYFLLVKNYISRYEIRAIQKEKLKKMELEEDGSAETGAIEVEMTETKPLSRDFSQTAECDV